MSTFNQLKQLSKDSLYYGLGSALQKFIGFFLFPIYTRVLTQEDFGTQDLVFTAVTILSYFLILGLDSATARHYYDAEDPEEKRIILSSWLWFELVISIPVCIVTMLFAETICLLAFNDPSLASFLRLGIVSIPFSLISSVTALALRLTFRSRAFSVITTAGVIAQAVSAIIMVPILGMGITGVFLSHLIANIFRACLGMIITHDEFIVARIAISGVWLRPMLLFGLPLVPASLSLWILNYANRFFLVRFSTLSDIGIFGIGVRLSSIVAFIISAFQIAWGPFSYSLIKDSQLAKDVYSKALTYFLLVSLFFTVSLSLFSREAITVLATSSYESAAPLVPWLSLGTVAWGAAYIVGMGTGIAKKSYHTTISVVLSAVLNTALNFYAIPLWGIMGAAFATLSGYLVALLYNYIAGQHYFHVVYEAKKVLTLIALSIAVILIGSMIDSHSYNWALLALFFKALTYVIFVVSLFVLKVIGYNDIAMLQKVSSSILLQLKNGG